MGWGILFIFVIIIVFAIAISSEDKNKVTALIEKQKNEITQELENKGINSTILCISGSKTVMYDEDKQLFINVDYFHNRCLFLPFNSIVECEILEDNSTIKKASVGRAIVGGIIAGGAGAIIGGTTGKHSNVVNSMRVRIVTNDINNSLVWIDLIQGQILKDCMQYRECLEFANRVYALCTAIISNKDASALA